MTINVGVLTAGGDTPGLNAALRGLGKSASYVYDLQLVGFYDGFRGLLHDRHIMLDESALSGILTIGGTILGTSRDKPAKMQVGGKVQDMRDAMVETYKKHHLDVLVCMGGGGTQKNAFFGECTTVPSPTAPNPAADKAICRSVRFAGTFG